MGEGFSICLNKEIHYDKTLGFALMSLHCFDRINMIHLIFGYLSDRLLLFLAGNFLWR